jgi:hypothetical protein
VERLPLWNCGPLSTPQMIHEQIWSSGGMILTEEFGEKAVPLGSRKKKSHMDCPRREPWFRGEKPVTNRLSYGTGSMLRHKKQAVSLLQRSMFKQTRAKQDSFHSCSIQCLFHSVYRDGSNTSAILCRRSQMFQKRTREAKERKREQKSFSCFTKSRIKLLG